MAYEMKPGQGSAFKNENKTEDWHAAYRGKVMLPDGSMHYIDASPKKTAAGETFINFKIGKQIEGAPRAAVPVEAAARPAPAPIADDDTDIPF